MPIYEVIFGNSDDSLFGAQTDFYVATEFIVASNVKFILRFTSHNLLFEFSRPSIKAPEDDAPEASFPGNHNTGTIVG